MLSSAGRLLADAKRVRASNARPSEKAIAGDQKAIARLITTIERMNFSSFLRSDNSKLLHVWASYLPTYLHTYLHTYLLRSDNSKLLRVWASYVESYASLPREQTVLLRHSDLYV